MKLLFRTLPLIFVSTSVFAGLSYSFGPSPRSSDFRKMFIAGNHYKMSLLREKTEYFKFHPLHYSTRGPRDEESFTFPHNAYLSSDQLLVAARSMNHHGFKVAIETSLGFGHRDSCLSSSSVNTAAAAAANYEIEMLNRLKNALLVYDKGIDKIYIDGPFLRLLSLSKKSHSCGDGLSSLDQGHNMRKSAKIVNKFFSLIHNEYPNAELHLTLNIINWKQGEISPYYGTNAYDLDDQLELFFNIYKNQSEYRLSGFQFDAPYAVINRDGETSRRNFLKRLGKLHKRIHDQLGSKFAQNTKYSIIVNSLVKENFYKLGFMPHNYNPRNEYSGVLSDNRLCRKADRLGNRVNNQRVCMLNDYYFFKDSITYADLIKGWYTNNSNMKKLKNLNIDFASWHSAPKYNITSPGSYLNLFVGYLDGKTGKVLRSVIDRP